MKFMILVC